MGCVHSIPVASSPPPTLPSIPTPAITAHTLYSKSHLPFVEASPECPFLLPLLNESDFKNRHEEFERLRCDCIHEEGMPSSALSRSAICLKTKFVIKPQRRMPEQTGDSSFGCFLLIMAGGEIAWNYYKGLGEIWCIPTVTNSSDRDFEEWISKRQAQTRSPWDVTHPPSAAILATETLRGLVGGMTDFTLTLPWNEADSVEKKLPSEEALSKNGCTVIQDKERKMFQVQVPPRAMVRIGTATMKPLEDRHVLWSYEIILPDIIIYWVYEQAYDYVIYSGVRSRS